ncbi:hypothetical protein KKA24_00430 [Patescibacteria group bacterium]|nr:hypothetical protein [Patescibacteria group bacterium]
MKKQIIIMALVLCFGIAFYTIAAWSNPTAPPSGGNVPAPINTGTVPQLKNGGLGINGLFEVKGAVDVSGNLEVRNGPIKATGGLIIETRTSDPASPVTGQIWLRTDL